MPSLSRMMNLVESKTLLWSSHQSKKRWKKRWLRPNRTKTDSQQLLEKRRWRSLIKKESPRCLQVISLLSRLWEHKDFFPRLKWWLTSSMMMLREWIRCFSTPKLSVWETNNWKNPNNSRRNILKNRRNLILWWKSKDSRVLLLTKKEKLRELRPDWWVNKSSLIRFKKDIIIESKRVKWEKKKDNKCKLKYKPWEPKKKRLQELNNKKQEKCSNKLKLPTSLILPWNNLKNREKEKKMMLSTNMSRRSNKENMNIKWKKKESKMKRREKFKSLEISRKRLLTDKGKLMLSELKELMRHKKEMPDK